MIPAGVFAASALAILYTLVGYPLLLAWLARRFARPVHRQAIFPAVSAIVPVFNGQHFLGPKLDSLLALHYPPGKLEILVVSDGSTDQTEAIARSYASRGVRLLALPRGGKCAALNAAVPLTSGEILLLTDVRQLLAPDSLAFLVQALADPAVGAVSGELRIRSTCSREAAEIGLYWRLETWIRHNLARLDSLFGATGPFYALRRSLFQPLPPDLLLDDMYLPLTAFFRGYRLVTEPRALAFDIPTNRATEFTRKVRTLAGNYQLLRRMPALLGNRNRLLFHFLSYKVARLLLPWFLLALLVSSAFLPAPANRILVALQAAAYFLAAIDPWLPAHFPAKKWSSPARTFLSMMAATVCALQVLFVPPRTLWKVTAASAEPDRQRSGGPAA